MEKREQVNNVRRNYVQSAPPTSSAAREPGEATTCALSDGHRVGATRRSTGACSASTWSSFHFF